MILTFQISIINVKKWIKKIIDNRMTTNVVLYYTCSLQVEF